MLAGTSEGRIFSLHLVAGTGATRAEMPVDAPRTAGGLVAHFVIHSDTDAFAISTTEGEGDVLRLAAGRWAALPNFPRGEGRLYALEADWTQDPKTLFAASDARVFLSRDSGDTWAPASDGLPRRPHCSELSFVAQPDGARFLYLSTWGRSAWRARLG